MIFQILIEIYSKVKSKFQKLLKFGPFQIESGASSIQLEPPDHQHATPSYAIKNANSKSTKPQPQQKLPNQQLHRFSANNYPQSEEEVKMYFSVTIATLRITLSVRKSVCLYVPNMSK